MSLRINTVEDEMAYITKVWSSISLPQQIILVTYIALYIYFLLVCIAAHNDFTRTQYPNVGKAIVGLSIFTFVVTFLPVISHYMGISTFGIIHLMHIAASFCFIFVFKRFIN